MEKLSHEKINWYRDLKKLVNEVRRDKEMKYDRWWGIDSKIKRSKLNLIGVSEEILGIGGNDILEKKTERRLVRQRKSRIGTGVCYGLVCDSLPKVYILKLLLPMWWYLKMWHLGWNLGKMRSWEWGPHDRISGLTRNKGISLFLSMCTH